MTTSFRKPAAMTKHLDNHDDVAAVADRLSAGQTPVEPHRVRLLTVLRIRAVRVS